MRKNMKAEQIRTIAIIGAGIMGQGIAQNFAQAGLNANIVDIDNTQLEDCRKQIKVNLKLFKEFGLLKEEIPCIESRISFFLMSDLKKKAGESDFILEAIPEKLELKKSLFQQLDSYNSTAILASNTSSFTMASLSEGCRRPERIIGVHYFNPAHIMPLVELHFSPDASQETIENTQALMIKIGKKPVLVKKEVPGFIVNRIQSAMGREILHLLSEGVATPEDMDIASKASYGFRYACIGCVEALDMIGLDTLLIVNKNLFKQIESGTDVPAVLTDLVNKGELGVKTGQGFYDYHGKSKEAVLEEQNRRLLQQLALFNKMESRL
jgi:3-hydroxybutyryl-CoA dehydrogenase